MNMSLFLAVFGFLSVIYLILGFLSSKHIKDTNDYFLAGKNLGLLSVTLTLIATQLGGGMLLGTSAQAYKFGYYGIFYTLGMSIGFLILGSGLAARMQALNITTVAELFETRYNSVTLKKLASILSMMTMSGIIIGQIIASRTLLAGLGISNELIFIGFWLFVIVYTMVGGLKAVVVTDIFQVLYIIAIFLGIFFYCLWFEPFALFSLKNFIAHQAHFKQTDITLSMLAGSTLLTPILFSLIEQDLAQRFFAARTKGIAALSALLASFFMISFSVIPIYFGMKGKFLNLSLQAGANPLMAVIGQLTHSSVVVFALCGIIAAITSTADSLLCAISSNAAIGFDWSFLRIKNKLKLAQYITLVIGLITLGASYFVPQDIIGILTSSYEISVACLFVPIMFAYYKTDLKRKAAIGSIIGGLFGLIFFRIYPIFIPREIITLMLSFIGYKIGDYVD